MLDDDEIDDEEDEEEEDDYFFNDSDEADNYEHLQRPEGLNYDTALPSSHDYLGTNFEDVSAPRSCHEFNDEITLPLIGLPGNESNNGVQLIPGQIMPVYFYSPLQIQIIRKRMTQANPTIGFVLNSSFFRLSEESLTNPLVSDSLKLGIVAEIMSASYDTPENPQSMLTGVDGLIIKVKGRDRFRVLSTRRDITGCVIAKVRILPEYVMSSNPLMQCKNELDVSRYLSETKSDRSLTSRVEAGNVLFPHPAWVFRMYDCNYLIEVILDELNKLFSVDTMQKNEDEKRDFKNPKIFCSWLLTNFPFDNKMRIDCLRMDCLNHRLMFMHKLIRSFTNISCSECGAPLCSKLDVFCISKQGFTTAYLNPGGIIHETLTVFKLRNFVIMRAPPSAQHSWFPG
jgi:cereblon